MLKARILFYVCATLLMVNCAQPEPRRPIQQKTGKYFGANVSRNKALLEQEEGMIKTIMAKDSLHLYEHSASGSWFYYVKKNDTATYLPKPNDLVTMTYTVMGFENDTIYSGEEIGIKKYKVDMEELFPGLRYSVKLLKEGETATFLFPSSLGYGYQGDGDRIGVNVPLKCTLTLLKIEKEEQQ